MITNKIAKVGAVVSGLFASVSSVAFAQTVNLSINTNTFPTNSQRNVGNLLSFFIKLLFAVGGVLMLIYLILGGVRYITSGGDKVQAQAARDMITHALIGIIIIASSYAIANLLNTLFGINIFNASLTIPSDS
jgi:hypothetical protein